MRSTIVTSLRSRAAGALVLLALALMTGGNAAHTSPQGARAADATAQQGAGASAEGVEHAAAHTTPQLAEPVSARTADATETDKADEQADEQTTADARARLDATVAPLVARYDMGVSVIDRRTGLRWSYRGSKANNMASLTKFSTSVAVFLNAYENHRSVTSAERARMTRALQVSDNDAQRAQWDAIGGHEGYRRQVRKMGLNHTYPVTAYSWGRTVSTADDQAALLLSVLDHTSPLRPADADWIRRTMRGVDGEQTWGAAPFGRAPGRTIEVKNGWSPYSDTGLWRLTSLGHVSDARHDYVISIMSNGWGSMESGRPRLDAVGRQVYAALKH